MAKCKIMRKIVWVTNIISYIFVLYEDEIVSKYLLNFFDVQTMHWSIDFSS